MRLTGMPKVEIYPNYCLCCRKREIRDVLITGGDALMLNDRKLDWILGECIEFPCGNQEDRD